MLHIREVSDLHLEHYYDLYNSVAERAKEELKSLIPPLPTDKKSVLIVAGDLATARRVGRIVTFMKMVAPRFKHIIYVLGNHEHYSGTISTSEQIIVDALSESGLDMSKITVAGNSFKSVEISGVTFHCGTLWTSYNGGDLTTSQVVSRYITDHKVIQNADGSLFTTEDARAIHVKMMGELRGLLEGKDNSKTVVVTHHMPSYEAVADEFKFGDPTTRTLNAAFATDLDHFIMEHKPAYWFFGHTHTQFEGKVGDTLLVCNPLGYPRENNKARGVFNTSKVFSI